MTIGDDRLHPSRRSIRPAGLHVEKDGPIWTVRLDRPATRNAIDRECAEGLARAWRDIDADPDARAVVLTGTAGSFCAGADLRSLNDPGSALALLEQALLGPASMRVPVVAAVNGGCFGGGMSLLLACDVRIAATDARFGTQAARMGLFPFGAVAALTRDIGTAAAADLLLTGRHFSAAEAAALGVVGRVCPPDDLEAEARHTAETIADNAPLTVAAIKRTYGAVHRLAVAAEREAALEVLGSEDAEEGVQAFLGRRRARFLGR